MTEMFWPVFLIEPDVLDNKPPAYKLCRSEREELLC